MDMDMLSADNRGMLSVDGGDDPRLINYEESKITGHNQRGADMRYSMQHSVNDRDHLSVKGGD
jgi:hypothetical protein